MRISFFLFFLFCLIGLVTLDSCSGSKSAVSADKPEDFDQFYDRFHADENFQMSRIQFPLGGKSVDTNGERVWTPDNWIPMKVKIMDVDTNTYKVDYNKTEDTFVQKFWLPGSGFSAEYRFARKNGQWFLVYAMDSNL